MVLSTLTFAALATRSTPASRKILDTGGRVAKFEKRFGKQS
jgi:hypothetical protein